MRVLTHIFIGIGMMALYRTETMACVDCREYIATENPQKIMKMLKS